MAKSDAVSLETGMLAFSRSLQVSEGVFHATFGTGDDLKRRPIEVLEKGVRGQSSEDNAKSPGLSNPQSVEFAVIPQGCDTVELSFNVRVLPSAMEPDACDKPEVRETYKRLASRYAVLRGFETLADLYVWNIANARFAWRNRYQSDRMSVEIKFEGTAIAFDPLLLDLDKPADRQAMAQALIQGSAEDLDQFLNRFAEALEKGAFFFSVIWRAAMQPGQEIFPSQEYLREDVQKKDLSRVYAKMPIGSGDRKILQAAMHSQKIGAAIRHIDIWHGQLQEYGPIAVNPYGGVQGSGDVVRKPTTKRSFYDLRRKAAPLLESVENASSAGEISAEVHFVMANLVRGGVFGKSTKKKEAAE